MRSIASLLVPAAWVALALPPLGPAQAQTAEVPPPVSSDQNVPPATARKQAAEIAAGDPLRWSREDSDSAARMKTLRKETAAALQESLGNCRTVPKAERAACTKEARDIYRQEMAGLRARLAAGQ